MKEKTNLDIIRSNRLKNLNFPKSEQNSIKKGNLKLNLILLFCITTPFYIYFRYIKNSQALDEQSKNNLENIFLTNFLISFISFILTFKMIPYFAQLNYLKKIFGVDINKCENIRNLDDPERREIPESLGIVPSVVFLIVIISCQNFILYSSDTQKHLELISSLLSICFMIFLGFADDILDLRWRYKLFLPTIASLPLLMAYNGSTTIIIPKVFTPLLEKIFHDTEGGIWSYAGLINQNIGNVHSLLNLGILYKIYMSMLAVFCTNSINIYAGINGLEVGQSIIIGFSILVFNMIEIFLGNNFSNNIFSLIIVLQFLSTSLALFYYNRYPSDVFIGDTYCYFAGMTFACIGILGHFSKTLLLFFIPQILNFLISIPQLIGIIPCPRHRLPRYDSKTRLLHGQNHNWNLLNWALRLVGPQREQDICIILLTFQIFCSILALFTRYYLIDLLF